MIDMQLGYLAGVATVALGWAVWARVGRPRAKPRCDDWSCYQEGHDHSGVRR